MKASDPKDQPTRLVPCPHCGTLAAFAASNRWRPFCSQRCRSIDLGAWASESYRVASTQGNSGPPESGSDEPDSR